MNKVIIAGRLTKDPELRYFSNDMAVASFVVAVDKQLSKEKRLELESRNQPTADFPLCKAFGKQAENIAKFTAKGKRVLISGAIQTGAYDDKDGKRIYTTEILVQEVEFIDWKDSSQNTFDNSSSFQNRNNSTIGNFPTVENAFDFGDDFDPSQDDGRIPF